MLKKKSIYTKYLFTFKKNFFPQAYLIWASKLAGIYPSIFDVR